MLRYVIAIAVFVAGASCAQAQSDSRMKRIADSKVVKIAYRADATPYSFADEKKEAAGYSIDLCKAIVDSMGRQLGSALKIEWVQVTTQTRFQAVASGQADMVALARGFLDDPRWVWHAAEHFGVRAEIPPQYARTRPDQWPGAQYARPRETA